MRRWLIALVLLAPMVASAHSGAKSLGDRRVSLQQVPLSPLVSEKVRFSLVVETEGELPAAEEAYNVRIMRPEGLKVHVLTDTTYKTNAQGRIELEQSFSRSGSYVLVVYPSQTGPDYIRTEFLIQVRANFIGWPVALGFASLGLLAGLVLAGWLAPGTRRKEWRTHKLKHEGVFSWLSFGHGARLQVRENQLRAEWFPWLKLEADLGHLTEVAPARWRWWQGWGLHVWGRSLSLNASRANLVELKFDLPQTARVFGIKYPVKRLYLSLEDPQAFQDALGSLRL